jgi:hypothetical protein
VLVDDPPAGLADVPRLVRCNIATTQSINYKMPPTQTLNAVITWSIKRPMEDTSVKNGG